MGATTTATPTGRLTTTTGKGPLSTPLLADTLIVPPSDSSGFVSYHDVRQKFLISTIQIRFFLGFSCANLESQMPHVWSSFLV